MAEYEVPRSLDEPDQSGIPFFTMAQFFVALAGVVVAVAVAKTPDAIVPFWAKTWLCIYVPVLALLLPRSAGKSGWTNYRIVTARAGRLLRPRRTIWKPEG